MNAATRTEIPVGIGPDLVRQFLPHRPPFLFVDTVEAFSPGDRPSLSATHYISPNEPVFAGHFPHLYLWPGVYTIEGLAQSCLFLNLLLEVGVAFPTAGELAPLLRSWQQSVSRPGTVPDPRAAPLRGALTQRLSSPDRRTGLLVAADVKLVHPVFAGQRLDYHVQRTHEVDRMHRFDVEAAVARRTVASGRLTVAMEGGAS